MTESSAMTTVLGWMQSMVYAGGALFATSLMLLYVYQEKLLYHPSMPGVPKLTTDNPKGYRHPGEYGIDFEDVYIPTKDGISIHAWLLKQADMKKVPTIVFFHGNAGNIGFRLPNAVQMYRMLGCNIVMVDYRGFGLSLGVPTEKGIQMDAEATIDYLSMRQDLDNTKFIAFGRSLGGAVAIYLGQARSDKIAAIIVENTFLSISSMVDSLMPWLSYFKGLVLAMDWSNERRIVSLTQPILFLSGQKDELVPPFHMKKLHDLASQSKLRKWYPIAQGTHNDSWVQGGAPYFDSMRAFIERICEMTLENKKKLDEQVCADGQEIPNMLDSTLFQHVKAKDKDV